MPAIAGFYAVCLLPLWLGSLRAYILLLQSYQDCREWLKVFDPDKYDKSERYAAVVAIKAAEDMMRKLTKRKIFEGEILTPLGSSGDPYDIEPRALMLVRRYSPHKAYMAPSRRGFDVNGKKLIKQHLGLKVSDWKVVWYDEDDPALHTFVLKPKLEDNPGLGVLSS
ncbi:hypothetical protein FRC10_010227 [Ceratobasidium sp. 414]|nr:hypothetical protein FRC10_010227 [Ceratobasidium sp. 414]